MSLISKNTVNIFVSVWPPIALLLSLIAVSPAVKGIVALLFPDYPRLLFSYVVLFMFLLLMVMLSIRILRILQDRLVQYLLILVFLVTTHYLITDQASLVDQIKALLQYKLLLGIGIAALLYLMSLRLIKKGRKDFLLKLVGGWFGFLCLLNLAVLLMGTAGRVSVDDSQILENNRASFELFTVGLFWVLLSKPAKGSEHSWVNLDFWKIGGLVAIAAVSMAYSTRSVQLAVLVLLVTLVSRNVRVAEISVRQMILPIVIIGMVVTAIISPSWNIVRYGMFAMAGEEVVKSLDDNVRLVDAQKNQIPEWLVNGLDLQRKDAKGNLAITKSKISTISRFTQIVQSIVSLGDRPFGRGYQIKRDRIIGYSNHSMFFVLLEDYGILWLAYVGGAFFVVRRSIGNWFVLIPLGVNMLFMPNMMATALWAFSIRQEDSTCSNG